MIWDVLLLLGITVVPWIELRGSIPVGIAMGYHPLWVLGIAVAANCLVIVPCFVALDLLYNRLPSRWGIVHAQVERVRARGAALVERYELLGLAIFVAIPLPGTGAYSGTLLAWLLGIKRRPAVLAISAGVLAAGAVVTIVATGVISAVRRLL